MIDVRLLIEKLRPIYLAEQTLLGGTRPMYHFNGRELEWGKDLTAEQMEAMKTNSEIFLLKDAEKKPFTFILSDWYGTLREYRVEKLLCQPT